MKLRIPEFAKNKIEQGRNYKIDNPLYPTLVISLDEKFDINSESIEGLFVTIRDI